MLHRLLARRMPHRCGLVIQFPGLLSLQPFRYGMTHIPILFITIILHLFRVPMAQHHTDLPRLLARALTVPLVTMAVSPTEVHRADIIHLLTTAAFHPVAVVMAVFQVVAMVLPQVEVVAADLLAVVHPMAAVVPLAATAVLLQEEVVVVPQAPLPDLLLPPVFLPPLNPSP